MLEHFAIRVIIYFSCLCLHFSIQYSQVMTWLITNIICMGKDKLMHMCIFMIIILLPEIRYLWFSSKKLKNKLVSAAHEKSLRKLIDAIHKYLFMMHCLYCLIWCCNNTLGYILLFNNFIHSYMRIKLYLMFMICI